MAKPPQEHEPGRPGGNPFAGVAGGQLSEMARKGGKPVAIALRYQQEKDPAPRVVASGEGSFAQQLLEIAFANGIKVREDADLAQVLSAVEVDSIIPLEAFAAVAEIIAYLYRVNAGPAVGSAISAEEAARRSENPLQARARAAAEAMQAWNAAAASGQIVPGAPSGQDPDRKAGADEPLILPGTRHASGAAAENATPAPDFLDLASKTDRKT